METLNIINNQTFQQYALTEALHLLSKDTGISVESLVKQFPTNKKLQETCAKIVVETAKQLSK
ncbi:hypothetical protein PQD09_gp05 [Providencia phage PSTCR4]|uniref:Uncharacterized protein n=1 Tax=Providencia phage PSTCR4 TaxID=2783546 RepID=A0A873WKN8_9CAUD|nr:hypothetical protein PQD09_gp05 [Providencia phage PSTCR4]QPB12026.1 hypothetical protein [Providencia phage PSTCR4]